MTPQLNFDQNIRSPFVVRKMRTQKKASDGSNELQIIVKNKVK